MPSIPDLCHDIANSLNSATIISGVLRDMLVEKELPQDVRDELSKGLQKIEDSSVKAGKYLDELRSVLRQMGAYKKE